MANWKQDSVLSNRFTKVSPFNETNWYLDPHTKEKPWNVTNKHAWNFNFKSTVLMAKIETRLNLNNPEIPQKKKTKNPERTAFIWFLFDHQFYKKHPVIFFSYHEVLKKNKELVQWSRDKRKMTSPKAPILPPAVKILYPFSNTKKEYPRNGFRHCGIFDLKNKNVILVCYTEFFLLKKPAPFKTSNSLWRYSAFC